MAGQSDERRGGRHRSYENVLREHKPLEKRRPLQFQKGIPHMKAALFQFLFRGSFAVCNGDSPEAFLLVVKILEVARTRLRYSDNQERYTVHLATMSCSDRSLPELCSRLGANCGAAAGRTSASPTPAY